MLVTSHILAEIERTADRAAILLDGRLLTVEPVVRAGATLVVDAPPEAAEDIGRILVELGSAADGPSEALPGGRQRWRLAAADSAAADRVAAALATAGVATLRVTPEASNLEARFLDLTRSKAVA